MELINTKKLNEPVFCEICEKERKHVVATYQSLNDSNELYTIDFQRCKSCGKEKQLN